MNEIACRYLFHYIKSRYTKYFLLFFKYALKTCNINEFFVQQYLSFSRKNNLNFHLEYVFDEKFIIKEDIKTIRILQKRKIFRSVGIIHLNVFSMYLWVGRWLENGQNYPYICNKNDMMKAYLSKIF